MAMGRAGQGRDLWRQRELWIFRDVDAAARAGLTQREVAVVPSSGARLEVLRRCKGAFRGVTDRTRRMGPVVVNAVDPATAWGASYGPGQSMTKVTRAGLDRTGGGCPSSAIDPKGGGGGKETAQALPVFQRVFPGDRRNARCPKWLVEEVGLPFPRTRLSAGEFRQDPGNPHPGTPEEPNQLRRTRSRPGGRGWGP
jgi:hypothetical protein